VGSSNDGALVGIDDGKFEGDIIGDILGADVTG
jgi:hypothetical protein